VIPVVAGSNPVRHPSTARRADAAPVKAAAVALPPGATIEDAFRTVVRAALAQVEANAFGVLHSLDLEFVHQMRVGMRRFRSSLIAFRAAVPREASARIRLELRDVALAIGTTRDWDVLCQRIAAVGRTRFPERDSLEALKRHVLLRRAASVRRARKAIDAGDFAGALQRVERWLVRAPWRGIVPAEVLGSPVAPLARRALKRLQRKARECGNDVSTLPGDARHQLRVRIKRLRYACEFFASLYPRRRTRIFIRRLQQLQDTLGELNDIAVACRMLGNTAALPARARRAIARMHERDARRERRLLIELDAQWKILKAADPFW
jgi:triphosphatase